MKGSQRATKTKKSATKKSPMQSLYALCKKTFTHSSDGPPPSQAIQEIRSLLDDIRPSDAGLREDNVNHNHGHGLLKGSRRTPLVESSLIRTHTNFWITAFRLPSSSAIPLHDHPGMTVLSKLLYGSVHVKAYDWVEPCSTRMLNGSPVRLARLVMDKDLTAPCETSVLYPASGGNIHCFTAVTSCALLDVSGPPYSILAGRSCAYYQAYPYSNCPEDGLEASSMCWEGRRVCLAEEN